MIGLQNGYPKMDQGDNKDGNHDGQQRSGDGCRKKSRAERVAEMAEYIANTPTSRFPLLTKQYEDAYWAEVSNLHVATSDEIVATPDKNEDSVVAQGDIYSTDRIGMLPAVCFPVVMEKNVSENDARLNEKGTNVVGDASKR